MKFLNVNNFSGGINNYVSPKAVSDGQMTVLRNGIGDGVCLRPAKAPSDIGIYSLETLGHYGWKNRSVVKWYGRWYWSINDAATVPHYGGNEELPGVPYPDVPAVQSVATSNPAALSSNAASAQATVILVDASGFVADDYLKIYDNNNTEYVYVLSISANTLTLKSNLAHAYTTTAGAKVRKIEGLTGTFQYCLTYLNASRWESAPGNAVDQWWITKTFENQTASIKLPDAVPSSIKYIRAYRSTDQGNTFYMLGEYDVDTLLGSYVSDALADIDLVLNTPLETINLLPPPDGGKYLTERDGVFFVAVNDRLFISEQSNPHGWNPANWIGFDGYPISSITKEYNGILVFTANKTFRVTGSDITTITKQEIPGQQGCVNWRTIGTAGTAPSWVSNDGICVWDGSNIQIVTKQKYVWNGDAVHAVSANDRYYLFLSSGIVAIFDYRAGGIFREMEYSTDYDYGWYDPNLDRFYLAKAQSGQNILQFESGASFTLKYVSGILPQDGMVQKRFRRILIDAAGEVTAKITSDTGRILNITLLGSGRLQGFFPSGFYGRGLAVQLESGKEIYSYSIEYEEIGI